LTQWAWEGCHGRTLHINVQGAAQPAGLGSWRLAQVSSKSYVAPPRYHEECLTLIQG